MSKGVNHLEIEVWLTETHSKNHVKEIVGIERDRLELRRDPSSCDMMGVNCDS